MTSLLSFIKIANDEHDALSEYCNALSLLSREINKSQPPEISQLSAEDPMHFIPQENEVESALVHYTSCLKNLKLRHSNLVKSLREMESQQNESESLPEVFAEHVELSGRVLTTCASSASRGFGALYENGLLKNLSGAGNDDWHEIRIVSLVSLRASIEIVKNKIEAIG